jgi:hypothetical protein
MEPSGWISCSVPAERISPKAPVIGCGDGLVVADELGEDEARGRGDWVPLEDEPPHASIKRAEASKNAQRRIKRPL